MENPAETLRSEVDAFLERAKITPTAFGWEAIRDPNFVRNLRAGREPRFDTVLRVMEYIKAHAGEPAA